MEDLWLAATFQRHLEGIQAEHRVKAVGEFPAVGEAFSAGVHMSGEEIHDRHQVQEAFLEGDVGDIGRPDLIHGRDQIEIHQAGETFGWMTGKRGSGFLVDRR